MSVKATIRARLERHWGYIHALAYSPDGLTLAAGDSGGTIKLWDIRTGKERAKLEKHRANVLCLAFSPDGKLLASGSLDGTVRLWDVATGREQTVLKGPEFSVSAVAFSPDGKSLAAGGAAGFTGAVHETYDVIIWKLATQEQITLKGHKRGVSGLAFTPDNQTLAVSSRDGTLRLWRVRTGTEIAALRGAGGGPLVITRDGKTILTATGDQVTLTDTATHTIHARLKFPGTKIYCLAISSDSKLLAAGGYAEIAGRGNESIIQFWDMTTMKEAGTLHGPSSYTTSLAFAPDGKTLASTGGDMIILLWNLEVQSAAGGKKP